MILGGFGAWGPVVFRFLGSPYERDWDSWGYPDSNHKAPGPPICHELPEPGGDRWECI